MRLLDKFETSLLLDAFEKPIPVGGDLDETLEMFCNSYGLLEQQYLPGYALGAWVITDVGKMVVHYSHAIGQRNGNMLRINAELAEAEARYQRVTGELAELKDILTGVRKWMSDPVVIALVMGKEVPEELKTSLFGDDMTGYLRGIGASALLERINAALGDKS